MPDINPSGCTSPLGQPHLLSGDLGYAPQGSVPFPIQLSKTGGMGFQYEGGIISVVALADRVDVSFDRPMVYNGAFTPTPPGTPFNIGAPVLDGGHATTLEIPVVIVFPTVVSVTPSAGRLVVVFSGVVSLTAAGAVPSFWGVSTTTGSAVAVTGVSVLANTVTLTTSEQTFGCLYVLNIASGLVSMSGVANTQSSHNFTGVGAYPSLLSAVPQSPSSVLLTFSEPVNEAEAMLITNYSVTGGLALLRVSHLFDCSYLLTTGVQTPGVIYTVTVSGIHDLAGNVVT